jgi:transcriptional regulator NrdR family protein
MKCPKCASTRIRVRDTRSIDSGGSVKRQRVCLDCEMMWITLEVDADQIAIENRAMTAAAIKRRCGPR